MKTKNGNVSEINERLKALSRPEVRIPDQGGACQAGQLWSPALDHPEEDTSPSWLFLLLRVAENDALDVVPCFRWLEWAGPDDVWLPSALVGAPLVAALSLKTTVNKQALGACTERLSEEAVAFVFRACEALDDPKSRVEYNWGMPYFGKHGVRQDWRDGISQAISLLQGQADDACCEEVPSVVLHIEDHPMYAWVARVFESADFQQLKCAAVGEVYTPCVLVGAVPPDADSDAAPHVLRTLHARSLSFDALQPGHCTGLCCEWWLEERIPVKDALVFVKGVGPVVGVAVAHEQENGILLILSEAALPPESPVIDSPDVLRIVLRSP